MQDLFLTESARAADVVGVIRKGRAAVKKVSGVKLELELKVVGEA